MSNESFKHAILIRRYIACLLSIVISELLTQFEAHGIVEGRVFHLFILYFILFFFWGGGGGGNTLCKPSTDIIAYIKKKKDKDI